MENDPISRRIKGGLELLTPDFQHVVVTYFSLLKFSSDQPPSMQITNSGGKGNASVLKAGKPIFV